MSATAKISDDGPDGQSDFALVNASAPAKISAIAVPDQSTATVGFVNTADGDRTAIVTAYDTDGKQVDRREIAIRPSASTSVRIADINDGDVAAIRLKDPAQAVVWNLRVGQKRCVRCENSPDLPSWRRRFEGGQRAGLGESGYDCCPLKVTCPNQDLFLPDGVRRFPPDVRPPRP